MLPFLDVNVWLPLVWEAHIGHSVATRWVRSQDEVLCFCRGTQLALLRHLCNPAIMGEDVLNNREAADLVADLTRDRNVKICAEPRKLATTFPALGKSERSERNQWTDAYLAAFAITGSYRLVTFDQGFGHYEKAGLQWELLKV